MDRSADGPQPERVIESSRTVEGTIAVHEDVRTLRSRGAKIALVVAAAIVVFLAALLLGVVFGTTGGLVVGLLIAVGALVFFTRTFRGPGEEVAAPRAWWRLTASPTAGYVVAALFAVQAVSTGLAQLGGTEPAAALIIAGVYLVIALAFLLSSMRLARAGAGGRATAS